MGQPSAMSRRRRIAVVMETDMSCFRDVIRGINTFANARSDWHLDLVSPFDNFLPALHEKRPAGLLLGPTKSREEGIEAQRLVRCCVGTAGQYLTDRPDPMVAVEADDRAVGRLA